MSTHISDELFSAELDGALSPQEAREVSEHIEGCVACRLRQDLMRATARAIAGLPAGEAPPALDLSFLPHAPSPVVLVPHRWRPPTWAAPAFAAAALLLVAVTFAPAWLRTGGGASSTSSTAARPQGGAVAQDNSKMFTAPQRAATAAPASGALAVPAPALGQGRAVAAGASQTYPDAGGLVLSIGPAASGTRAGEALVITVQARAGQAVQLTSFSLQVRRGSTASTIAKSTAPALGSGEQAGLSATWTAGQLAGTTSPGDYQLEGHAVLSSGRDLAVILTIQVN